MPCASSGLSAPTGIAGAAATTSQGTRPRASRLNYRLHGDDRGIRRIAADRIANDVRLKASRSPMKMMQNAAVSSAALEVFRKGASIERAIAGDARRASPLHASLWRGAT